MRTCHARTVLISGSAVAVPSVGAPREATNQEEANDMAGMLRKIIASGIAAKVVQEARKPENQAKIKKAISDFQAKRSSGGTGKSAY
jgi:hypothetical protein